jgi:hypothetical protein
VKRFVIVGGESRSRSGGVGQMGQCHDANCSIGRFAEVVDARHAKQG